MSFAVRPVLFDDRAGAPFVIQVGAWVSAVMNTSSGDKDDVKHSTSAKDSSRMDKPSDITSEMLHHNTR